MDETNHYDFFEEAKVKKNNSENNKDEQNEPFTGMKNAIGAMSHRVLCFFPYEQKEESMAPCIVNVFTRGA